MTLRVAMWSGPRNISTAMMRSFENRPDTTVVDEPFYAAFLAGTALNHPMREEVLKSQPTDWRQVAAMLAGPCPTPVFYQKHMTHHMLAEFDTDWMAECTNVFLIRRPEDVIASYREKHDQVSLEAIGVPQQARLFDQEADRLGRAPTVIDSADISAGPELMLRALCEAIGIPFTERMLSWPKGRRTSDGVWAPAWYDQVEQSTGFVTKAKLAPPELPVNLKTIADAARPYYERLAKWKLGEDGARGRPPAGT
ncbi:MAG: HAD family hydrolase [Alphaproteobacteria bacterium]|nr:HAD family hydrolase [Alphaproteobacteria bacterium]MBL6937956.1 HAD family hydrolase [Alphaproteobacteria bacterium]MBL7099219.1 HAD family hydrolase [Alphaproteobacteria bacterium]